VLRDAEGIPKDSDGFREAPLGFQDIPLGSKSLRKIPADCKGLWGTPGGSSGFHDRVRDYAQRDGKSGYIVDRTGQYRQGRHYWYRQCRH